MCVCKKQRYNYIFYCSKILLLVYRSIFATYQTLLCSLTPLLATSPLLISLQLWSKNLAYVLQQRPRTAPLPLALRLGGPLLHLKAKRHPLLRVVHPWLKMIPPRPKMIPPRPKVTTNLLKVKTPLPRVATLPLKVIHPLPKVPPPAIQTHRIPAWIQPSHPIPLHPRHQPVAIAMDNPLAAAKQRTEDGGMRWLISPPQILAIEIPYYPARVFILRRLFRVVARLGLSRPRDKCPKDRLAIVGHLKIQV